MVCFDSRLRDTLGMCIPPHSMQQVIRKWVENDRGWRVLTQGQGNTLQMCIPPRHMQKFVRERIRKMLMPVITSKSQRILYIILPNYKTAGPTVLPSWPLVAEFRPSPWARHQMGKVTDISPFSNQYYLSCSIRNRGAMSPSQLPLAVIWPR